MNIQAKYLCAAIFMAIFTLTLPAPLQATPTLSVLSDDDFWTNFPIETWGWAATATLGDGSSLQEGELNIFGDEQVTKFIDLNYRDLGDHRWHSNTKLTIDTAGNLTLTFDDGDTQPHTISGSISGVASGQDILIRSFAAGTGFGSVSAGSFSIIEKSGSVPVTTSYGSTSIYSDAWSIDVENVLKVSNVTLPFEMMLSINSMVDTDYTDANREIAIIGIPEPGSATLALLGLGGILLRRRRK